MSQQTKLRDRMNKTLRAQMHIGLWKINPPPDKPRSSRTWIVCLNWQDRNAKPGKYHHVLLSEKLAHSQARTTALALGKRCNLLVMRYLDEDDYMVIGVPKEHTNILQTRREQNALKELRKAPKIMAPTWVF